MPLKIAFQKYRENEIATREMNMNRKKKHTQSRTTFYMKKLCPLRAKLFTAISVCEEKNRQWQSGFSVAVKPSEF